MAAPINGPRTVQEASALVVSQPNFHNANRTDAENLLSSAKIGSYIFRPSSIQGQFVLSFKDIDSEVDNLLFKITPEGQYVCQNIMGMEKTAFSTAEKLAEVALNSHSIASYATNKPNPLNRPT